MTTYTAIIVDDQEHAISSLSRYVKKTPSLKLIGTYENPLEALEILSGDSAPDIAFLDVDMPELSGLALAGLTKISTQVIFVSAHAQYALDAYGLHASGYLLKPFAFETFLETVQHVCAQIARPAMPFPSEPLFFKASVKGKYIKIMSQEILYIEAMGNYVKIWVSTSETPKTIYMLLKEAEIQLKESNMIRISRSFIINTMHTDAVDGNSVTMSNGKEITVGPNYRSSFQDYLRRNTVSGN